jgi:Tfp pilus assembly protein PilO
MAQSLNTIPLANATAKPAAKRLIPVLLGGAGLVLLGGGGILVGLNSKLTTLQTSAQQKDTEVSSSQQVARRYQATLDNYNQTQAHIKYLETSVSDKSYVPTLLAQLQGLAAQTHLTVSAMRPSEVASPAAAPAPAAAAGGGSAVGAKKAPPPPPYDTLDVSVDISGSYADTNMFLYSLTRFPKIVSVDNVQMHPGAAAVPGGPLIVMTSLKLTAFMFHDADSSQTAATASQPTLSASQTAGASQPNGLPITSTVVPPATNGTVGGAVVRAATGAAAVTTQANARSNAALQTL